MRLAAPASNTDFDWPRAGMQLPAPQQQGKARGYGVMTSSRHFENSLSGFEMPSVYGELLQSVP